MIITFGTVGGIIIVVSLAVFWPLVFLGIGLAIASCVLCCCAQPPADGGPGAPGGPQGAEGADGVPVVDEAGPVAGDDEL